MNPINIACVYSENRPYYTSEYLSLFENVLKDKCPIPFEIVCLSNEPARTFRKLKSDIRPIPFILDRHHTNASWWGKLELFRPDIEGSFLYFDLDNVITRPLDEIIDVVMKNLTTPIMIDDVDPRQKRFQSAVMWIPQSKKHLVWDQFIKNPDKFIKKAGAYGDAQIIRETEFGKKAYSFQYLLGENGHEKICSYRHGWTKSQSCRQNAIVVAMHGAKEKPLMPNYRKTPLVQNYVVPFISNKR